MILFRTSDSYIMLFIDFFSLLRNPVTTKKHYRLYIIFKVPQLRVIDFQRIRQKVNLNGLTCIYDSCVLYPHFSYHLHSIVTYRVHYLSVNHQWQHFVNILMKWRQLQTKVFKLLLYEYVLYHINCCFTSHIHGNL